MMTATALGRLPPDLADMQPGQGLDHPGGHDDGSAMPSAAGGAPGCLIPLR